jgi:hypothetical protein
VANTLAYYDTATITAVKSFIVQALGHLYKTFFESFVRVRHCQIVAGKVLVLYLGKLLADP